jgi:hypothetical protein
MAALESVIGQVHAVAATAVVRKTDAGDLGVSPVCRQSAANYVGDQIGPYDSYSRNQMIWENPPSAPSTDWTQALIGASEFGAKLTA